MATRAAAHIPTDADDVCECAFFHLVYTMKWENIPPCLVVNVDQMGMYVLPSNSRTFHDKGAKQVDAIAKDEKHAYTLLVASMPTGKILPFQQVWGSKTSASLPKQTAPGMVKAQEYRFDFAFAASESSPCSHFSTLKTMIEWIKNILVPWIKHVIEEDGLDEDQKSILYIDCYPVHAEEGFKTYVLDSHPNIILCFVPQNCTPVFQPADVGLQRPIKHSLKQSLFKYLAATHRRQMLSRLHAEDVRITTSLPQLQDASVGGLVKVYEYLQTLDGCDLIKKVGFTFHLSKFKSQIPLSVGLGKESGKKLVPF
ncbi:unnamed protein product [Cyclocybe aegerita]|uniref:DDE-1 domain-containing protein n=1 Tax=Cyclocybe aegerita TaxID=1973307 RepID=A0A8S0X5E1_CYCAE|nr:unnamed protein product [Cyclocybe aegerita]